MCAWFKMILHVQAVCVCMCVFIRGSGNEIVNKIVDSMKCVWTAHMYMKSHSQVPTEELFEVKMATFFPHHFPCVQCHF